MKTQTFGIEIEMTGLTRYDAAKTVAAYFGTSERYVGGTYSAYEVADSTGRIWKLMSDASIRAERKNGATATDDYKVELVSPICRYDDIETVQAIVRELRKGGDESERLDRHTCPHRQGRTHRPLAEKHSQHHGKQRRPAVQSPGCK